MSKTNVVVEVASRADTGKNVCRRLRKSGMIPGIVYGMGIDSFPVAVSPKRIDEIIRLDSGRNTIFTLSMEGGSKGGPSRAVMIRELVRDPITSDMLHVDFLRVDLAKVVVVNVPVRLLGTAHGVKNEGGVLEFIHREVEIECLPDDIPEHFDFDVSPLEIGQNVQVKDLSTDGRIKILDDPENVLLTVAAPTVTAEPEAPSEEEAEATEAETAGGEDQPAGSES